MNIELSLSIYTMQAISESRKAYKDYINVDIEKKPDLVCLNICVAEHYSNTEQKEIICSFLNYLLQSSAIKRLRLEV
jgi:hypothetical protein